VGAVLAAAGVIVSLSAAAPAVADPGGRWPLTPPTVVAPFAPPEVTWGSGHRGVDLAGSPGQPVRAALPGRVSFVGRIAGVSVVVVDHGATRTTYQPVEPGVARGQEVAGGEVVGTLAWFGTHCLPRACLHWGWLRGSTYLDPLELVGGPRPVRLLPSGSGAAPRAPAGGEGRAPVPRGQVGSRGAAAVLSAAL
jgi:murein DD-endopeptidase MepM/ murein hydrolase activator NlpD